MNNQGREKEKDRQTEIEKLRRNRGNMKTLSNLQNEKQFNEKSSKERERER